MTPHHAPIQFAAASGGNMNAAEWPSVWVVPPAQERRRISRGAVAYQDAVTRITCLLASSAAALAQHDYITADRDRHDAYILTCKLSQLIDETEREDCMDEDSCEYCGSPSMRRCTCDDDVVF